MADRDGNTPLVLALTHCQGVEVIEALLKAGADTNVRSSRDDSPLLICIKSWENMDSLCSLLLDYGHRVREEMCVAAAKGKNAIVHDMIAHGIVPHEANLEMSIPDDDLSSEETKIVRATPLYCAFFYERIDLVRYFLEINFIHDIDINLSESKFLYMIKATARYHKSKQCLELFRDFYTNAWPLKSLCFARVSQLISDAGNTKDKREKGLEAAGLPRPLVSSLMFSLPKTA